jgi:putative hydrolase of the HAD superfamily
VKYKAAVFDLYGTLVDNYGYAAEVAGYKAMLAEMAKLLGIEPSDYDQHWQASYPDRAIGLFETLEDELREVVRRAGCTSDDECVNAAAKLRRDFIGKYLLVPRSDAVETLAALRAQGLKTGLLSNCSRDTASLWADSPLAPVIDEPMMSCVVGLKKPDPALFRFACERLGAEPAEVMYVADGESNELAGAASVGLTPVLIRTSYKDPPFHRQPHVEPWTGLEVAWLRDVLDLVK